LSAFLQAVDFGSPELGFEEEESEELLFSVAVVFEESFHPLSFRP